MAKESRLLAAKGRALNCCSVRFKIWHDENSKARFASRFVFFTYLAHYEILFSIITVIGGVCLSVCEEWLSELRNDTITPKFKWLSNWVCPCISSTNLQAFTHLIFLVLFVTQSPLIKYQSTLFPRCHSQCTVWGQQLVSRKWSELVWAAGDPAWWLWPLPLSSLPSLSHLPASTHDHTTTSACTQHYSYQNSMLQASRECLIMMTIKSSRLPRTWWLTPCNESS